MTDFIRTISTLPGGWAIFAFASALVLLIAAAAGFVFLRLAIKGRAVEVLGIKIGEAKVAAPTPPTLGVHSSLESTRENKKPKHQKILYVKVIHLRRQSDGIPVYEFIKTPPGEPIVVYDEAAYYSLHLFSNVLPEFQWSVTSSGSAIPQAIHPWQDRFSFLEPQEAQGRWNNLAPICTEPSNVYLAVTTMYNGLQPGSEEVYAKVEHDAEYVRVILDLSSLAAPKPQFIRRPEGTVVNGDGTSLVMPVHEARPWVFTVSRENMRKRQVLKLQWELDWSPK